MDSMVVSSSLIQVLFRYCWDTYIRDAQGFLLVYSINWRHSFNRVIELHAQLSRIKDTAPMSVIIVGAKCDLAYEREVGIDGVSAAFPCTLIIALCCPYHTGTIICPI